MICKFCGGQLRAEDSICPHCGKPVPAPEGGVGFWDMLEGPADSPASRDAGAFAAAPAPAPGAPTHTPAFEEDQAMQNNPVRPGDGIARMMLPILTCCALSLASLVAAVVVSIHANAQLHDVTTELAAVSKDLAQEREDAGKMADRLVQLEAAVHELGGSDSFAAIVYNEQVSAPVGYKSEEGDYLFMVSVPTGAYRYSWQRKLANGSFEELAFDDDGIDAATGLKLVEGEGATSSSLVAVGLTSEAAGSYQCVVTNLFGDELVCSFELEESADGRMHHTSVPRPVTVAGSDQPASDTADAAVEEPVADAAGSAESGDAAQDGSDAAAPGDTDDLGDASTDDTWAEPAPVEDPAFPEPQD